MITGENLGRSDGDMDLSNTRAICNKIILKKFETYHDRRVGGIIITHRTDLNYRMNKGTVVSIGDAAARVTRLNIGDVVLYDHMATHYDFKSYAILTCKEADDTVVAKVISENPMVIQPLGDRILVQRYKLDESYFGNIVLPNMNRVKSNLAKVIALGDGRLDKNGQVVPFNVKVGDVVMLPKTTIRAGTELQIETNEYIMYTEDELIAVAIKDM